MRIRKNGLVIKVKQHKEKLLLLLAVIFIILFKSYVINRVIISGNSMESGDKNSYKNGDVVLTEKITKHYNISRFDVVVISLKGRIIIKRIIGLPNEIIMIENGKIYINDMELKEDNSVYIEYGGIAAEPYYLSDNEYFVLGDNRNESYDSREAGGVRKDQIIGKPVFRFFPVNRIGVTKDNPERER